MTRVLMVSTDRVGSAMAGPGIRAWELARALAADHTVTLAVPGGSDLAPEQFQLAAYVPGQPGALLPLLEGSSTAAGPAGGAEVVVGQGFVFELQPELFASPLPLAIDLYDPLILEHLHLSAHADLPTAQAQHTRYQALTTAQLQRGDFFFCATERQRDHWLGALTAAGRITPELVRRTDADLRSLLGVVPSGMHSQPPTVGEPVLRGEHPAIGKHDLLLLWAGGLWDWFDPAIVIRAVAALRAEYGWLRLCFFAGARPNPHGEPFTTRTAAAARALAAELGLLDEAVIFLDEWVEYAARGAYLAEADVGVSAHLPGIETRLAFRTRLLDYLWARLPVVCSAGDSLGDDLAQAGAALAVPPGDLEGWIAALHRIATNAQLRLSCQQAAENLARHASWASVAQPLAAFCASPRRTSSAPARPVAVDAPDHPEPLPEPSAQPTVTLEQGYVQHLVDTLAARQQEVRWLRALLGQTRQQRRGILEQFRRWLERRAG